MHLSWRSIRPPLVKPRRLASVPVPRYRETSGQVGEIVITVDRARTDPETRLSHVVTLAVTRHGWVVEVRSRPRSCLSVGGVRPCVRLSAWSSHDWRVLTRRKNSGALAW